MSTPNRNSILRSMGAEPKKKSSQLADSTQTTIQPNQTKSRPLSQLESTFPAQESLDQSNGQPSAVDTSTSITNGVDHEVIPIQSKSSVVSPSEVLNREDPVTRTRSTIQSRNLNLPPLASDTAKSNSPHQSKSNGKPAAGRLSKIFGGKKNEKSQEAPALDVRRKKYSGRTTADHEEAAVVAPALTKGDDAELVGEAQEGINGKYIWADHPKPVPESQKERSYRKPGAAVIPAAATPIPTSSQAPQIQEDVIHQERVALVDESKEVKDVDQVVGGEEEEDHEQTLAGLDYAETKREEENKTNTSAAAPAAAAVATKSATKPSTESPSPASIPTSTPITKPQVGSIPATKFSVGKRADKVASLTPEQRHYLLKSLVGLQMAVESAELEKLGALTLYGFPFLNQRPKNRMKDETIDEEFSKGGFEEAAEESYADEDQARRFENLKEPLIFRQMFHVNLRNFPGLDEASPKYWRSRIQPFFDEMAARNFSTSLERSEMTKRHFFANAITRYLNGYFARGFGVRGEEELKGPGVGVPGSERWGVGKQWGKGTVKRGLDKPVRPDSELLSKIDSMFGADGEEAKLWKLAGQESQRVKKDWSSFKESIIEKETGLEEVQQYLEISTIKNLPPQYKNAVEYARIHAAYIFRALFVENGDGPFNVLKGIHSLFPYWGAKQLLMYANAGTLISGILSLLLARPAGAKSLVQRVISFVLGGEMSTIQKEYIKPLKLMINDKELCDKIEAYIKRGNRAEGKTVRARAEKDGNDVLTAILLNSAGTQLSSDRVVEVKRMQKAFANSPLNADVNLAYPKDSPAAKEFTDSQIETFQKFSSSGGGVEREYAYKFAQLKLLLRESLKVRDREQAIKVASGSLIVNIIRDSLELVFYQPIKTIAATADLSDRLGDLQAFIDDLINVKKSKDDSIENWIALAARHENSLYYLFHECVSISTPFFDWSQVGCDYMAMGTTDPAHPANRKAKDVEINLEELLRDDRITPQDVEEIIKETDQLKEFTLWQKVRFELEMRKNYLLAKAEGAGKSGVLEDQLSSSMKAEISDLDALLLRLMNDAGVSTEDGETITGGRGTEQKEFPWAWFDSPDLYGQSLAAAERDSFNIKYEPQNVQAKNPQFVHIRKLLPAFCDHVDGLLPDWRSNGPAEGGKGSTVQKPATVKKTPSLAPTANDAKSTKSGKSGKFGSLFRKS